MRRLMEQAFDIAHVLLTPSCTAALEMAAMLCDVGPGDEVILPSYTFVSTANAFVLRGAKPVFVDIRPDNLNLDETLIEAAITPRTRAILPVHYAGVACEMDRSWRLPNSTACLSSKTLPKASMPLQGRQLGIDRPLRRYSFHETKNYILRRRRRAVRQRAGSSSGPRSFAKREPTAAGSSAAWWTSTPGSTWAVRTFPAKFRVRSCMGSWNYYKQSPNAAAIFTNFIRRTCGNSKPQAWCGCHE